jgi:hypothetical protein
VDAETSRHETNRAAAAFEAYRASIEATPTDLAAELQSALGQKLAAFMLNVRPQTFGDWATGDREPRGKNQEALRHLAHVYKLLAQVDDKHTIRAWFVGMNPMLNDDAPAELASQGKYRDLLIVARAFVQLG